MEMQDIAQHDDAQPTPTSTPLHLQGVGRDALERLDQFIDRTCRTKGSLAKRDITAEYDDIKDILCMIYDPLLTTGVSRTKVQEYGNTTPIEQQLSVLGAECLDPQWLTVFLALAHRQLTGHRALSAVNAVLRANPDKTETLLRVFDKDLKNGMGATTINKAFPGLVREFSVALATDFGKATKQFDAEADDWFISRKFDGVRCMTIIDDGGARCMSRLGRDFPALAEMAERLLVDLADIVSQIGPIVLDGEVCVINADASENFREAVSQVRRKSAVMKDYKYCVFDLLTKDEFLSKQSSFTLSERMTRFGSSLPYLDWVKQTPYSEEALVTLQAVVSDKGWEGLMLRKDAPYNGKRSKDILKVKKFHSAEYVVQDIVFADLILGGRDLEEGERPVPERALKSVVIHHRGSCVNVGSGWSAQQRREYAAAPETLMGKTIEVQYFEETQSTKTERLGEYSLRFPTVRYVWGDEREM